MSSLLLALLWSCGPKAPPVSAAAAPASTEAACPTAPPTGYEVQRGEASGAEAGLALASARSAATVALLERACAGVSETRCEAISRRVVPWKEGAWDPSTRAACASVAIEKAALRSLEADEAQLSQRIAALAQAVAAAAGGQPVLLAAPTWSSGCSAGSLGTAFAGRLKAELLGQGVEVLAAGPGKLTLATTLAAAADQVVADFTLHGAAKPAVGGFDFPADLFHIAPDEAGSCRSDADLGLTGGERAGAGGLTAKVELPSRWGSVCEGRDVEPAVVVSRPAKVQVYSVARDGRALLVWPPPGGDGRVQDRLSLGQMTAVAQPDAGDDRLVALAVDPAASFGETEGLRGFCELRGGLTGAVIPAGAAVGTATFSVLLPGQGGCPNAPARAREKMADLPICGL